MQRLCYDVVEVDKNLYVCIVPMMPKNALAAQEQAFIAPLLGDSAKQIMPGIWCCGHDNNVENRLALPPLKRGGRAAELLEILVAIRAFNENESEEE